MEAKAARPGTGRAIAAGLAAALLLKTFAFDFMIAEGRSMIPAIEPGTVLVVLRAAYGIRLPLADTYVLRWAAPSPGDVVVFASPGGSAAVKRCASVAEDGSSFFALGDNPDESWDSRHYGSLDADAVLGRVAGLR